MKSDRADLAGLRIFNMVSQRLRRGEGRGRWDEFDHWYYVVVRSE